MPLKPPFILLFTHTRQERSPAHSSLSPKGVHWAPEPKSPGSLIWTAEFKRVRRSLPGAPLPASHARFPHLFSFASPCSPHLGASPSLPLPLPDVFLSPSDVSKCPIDIHTSSLLLQPKKKRKQKTIKLSCKQTPSDRASQRLHSTVGQSFHVISSWVSILLFCWTYILTTLNTEPGPWSSLKEGCDP